MPHLPPCGTKFFIIGGFTSNYKLKCFQGSRLTFQLASPVASDRFDPVAKTNFSLARHLNIHCCIKSGKCSMDP